MTQLLETNKRFIRTILDQIRPLVSTYSSHDQPFLLEFLRILDQFEVNIESRRKNFVEQVRTYQEKYSWRGDDQHKEALLQTPFLWFSETFLDNACTILSTNGFYADDFYSYLLKHLKGGKDDPGVFQLVRTKTPLFDYKWEDLQYRSHLIKKPLKANELQIIDICYQFVASGGLQALDPQVLTAAIQERVRSEALTKKLPRFLDRIGLWFYSVFYHQAFDITPLFFCMKLSETTILPDIIDFHDQANTVLCRSPIDYVRGSPRTLMGIFYIPSDVINDFQNYLLLCEDQGKIVMGELAEAKCQHFTYSLALYKPDQGWSDLSEPEYQWLSDTLTNPNERKRRKKPQNFYFSSSFNRNWHYSQHNNPVQVIDILIKTRIGLYKRFRELPSQFSDEEKEIVQELLNNKVINLLVSPYRLFSEFSLDRFWIILPRIPYVRLKRLLMWLPSSTVFSSLNNHYIDTRLTPPLVRWMSTDLGWSVKPVISHHPQRVDDYSWYDHENLCWKAPTVLEEFGGQKSIN